MSVLGNIIWLVFGGFFIALEYLVSGFLLCCTIIGIPFGLQGFKIGLVALLPFSQTIALSHLGWGLLFCITIVGIPFGIQHFKLMRVALFPFGRTVIPS